MRRIYLDYASTTPVDSKIWKAMEPYATEQFGNPGSLHSFGQTASRAVFASRRSIARTLEASPEEIVFTSGATEANNLALRGALRAAKGIKKPKILVSEIEHESVLETARDLKRDGVEVVYVPVSRTGVVDLRFIKKHIDARTVLVSVMYANNEIGTIEPIQEIAEYIYLSRKKYGGTYPLFHTDAAQALQYLDCRVTMLRVDLMTLSSHKVYGPKGIGALYVRKHVPLISNITGGGQENGVRSGTEHVSGIVGFAAALALAERIREKECVRIHMLRDYFWNGVRRIYPRALSNTPASALPNNCNIYFPNKSAHDLLIALDMQGIAASAGSACASHTSKSSHVLSALQFPVARQEGSVRFSLGRATNKRDIDHTLGVLKKVLHKSL